MSGRSSVQDAVRVIVTRNPYLYRGLRMRVVNFSALARFIQEDVENIFGDDVDPNTIVTAVMRLSNQTFQEPEEPRSPLSGARLNLVTSVSFVTIQVPQVKHTEVITRILNLGVFDNYMTSLHQYRGGIKLKTNSPDANRLKSEFKDLDVQVEHGYAEIRVMLSPETERGVTVIVDALTQNGVYVIDASFAQEDVSIIVDEEDASRAFEALRPLTR